MRQPGALALPFLLLGVLVMTQNSFAADIDPARLAALEARDAGKVIRETTGQITGLRNWYHYYASLAYHLEGSTIPHDSGTLQISTVREPYGVIAVNPARHPGINARGARELIDWLTSPEGQARIASYKAGGETLFFPGVPKAPR